MDNAGLKKIHEYLMKNEWVDLKYGEYLSKDYKFKIEVFMSGNKFVVRSAILSIYDRWANSGSEDEFSTCDDVITFLNGKYVLAALDEVAGILDDGIDADGKMDRNTYKFVLAIIDLLDDYL